MIALIRKNKKEVYPSVVFAEFLDGINSQVVVFDPEYKNLICVYYWERQRDYFGNIQRDRFGKPCGVRYRNIFILDTDKSDWGSLRGYSWLLEDKNSMKALKKGKEVYPGLLRKCKERQEQMKLEEWRELTCDKDVDDLMEFSFNFHNARIVNVAREDGKITFDFELEEKSQVFMEIPEEGSALNIDEPWDEELVGEEWEPEIIPEAKIFYCDGYIYWIGNSEFDPADDLTEELSWFKATHMKWGFKINPLE